MNKSKVVLIDDGAAPRSGSKWMIYQALAGAWPVTLRPDDHTGLKALEDRFLPYVEKALREEKLRTSWDDNNDAYEQAVLGYVTHLLSADNQPFLVDFHRALQPFIRAGLVNSLTQAIIKLTAPGVPDIYQGAKRSILALWIRIIASNLISLRLPARSTTRKNRSTPTRTPGLAAERNSRLSPALPVFASKNRGYFAQAIICRFPPQVRRRKTLSPLPVPVATRR
jgi:hypothetical protein